MNNGIVKKAYNQNGHIKKQPIFLTMEQCTIGRVN